MKLIALLVTFSFLLCAIPEKSKPNKSYQWGKLDTDFLPEQSGMAASKQFLNRLYHHNDSGDGPSFYISDLKGDNVREIEIQGWDPQDLEDMVIGPYFEKQSLYFADIGDNDEERESVSFAIIEEVKNFADSVKPFKIMTVRYPDKPHNAEASILDSEGNLYVLTKKKNKPSKIFRLDKQQIESTLAEKTFSYWGEINIPKILNSSEVRVTSAALTKDGRTLFILTYQDLIEAQVNFSSKLEITKTRVIPLHPLQKQESVALLPDESGFIYSTESEGEEQAEIWRVDLDRAKSAD